MDTIRISVGDGPWDVTLHHGRRDPDFHLKKNNFFFKNEKKRPFVEHLFFQKICNLKRAKAKARAEFINRSDI